MERGMENICSIVRHDIFHNLICHARGHDCILFLVCVTYTLDDIRNQRWNRTNDSSIEFCEDCFVCHLWIRSNKSYLWDKTCRFYMQVYLRTYPFNVYDTSYIIYLRMYLRRYAFMWIHIAPWAVLQSLLKFSVYSVLHLLFRTTIFLCCENWHWKL